MTKKGIYTFFTNSDNGDKLYIDGEEIVNNDGHHPPLWKFGPAFLMPGYHTISAIFYNNQGPGSLDITYEGPDLPRIKIPTEVLFRPDH